MSQRGLSMALMLAACALSARTAFIGGRAAAPSPASRHLTEAIQQPRLGASSQAATSTDMAAALVGGCVALVLGAASRSQAQRLSASKTRAVRVVRRAEGESLLDSFRNEDDEVAKEEEAAIEAENRQMEELKLELSGDSITGGSADEEQEGDLKGARQISYDLFPSRQYVLYIAKQNAVRNWTKDGPDGKNIGCIEVQIAVFTERIRSMVLHCREYTHDYKCRMKLVSLVSRRRRLLDKLAVRDLEGYLKVREQLKIRHVYRMEALIGRLPAYRYTIRDRKQAPGRKVAMQLKKTKKLLNRRLANQLRQGKSPQVLHQTRKMITSRKWISREYDDVAAYVNNKEPSEYIDPLNMP